MCIYCTESKLRRQELIRFLPYNGDCVGCVGCVGCVKMILVRGSEDLQVMSLWLIIIRQTMANHDYRTASSPLSQLVLIKSPYLQLPHPVTLPYNYTPLPPSVDIIVPPLPITILTKFQPSTDFSQVLSSVELSIQRISALKSDHESHVDKIKVWEEQIQEREVREKRRIAPGYLDTDQRLLMPTRVDSPRVESPVTRVDGEDGTNELGKAFGNMGV